MADPLKIQAVQRGIDPVSPIVPRPAQPARAPEGKSFREVLTGAISEVERLRQEADQTVRQVVSGEIKDVSEAMVAMQKADIAFQTLMTVRSKVMNAYDEIMRMQV